MERLNNRLRDKAVLDGLVRDGLLPIEPTAKFVCIDHGQHPRTTLGTASSSDGQPPYLWLPVNRGVGIHFTRGVHWGGAEIGGRGRVIHVRCPRCGRHKRWGERKANEIIRQLLAANVTELDISLI